MLAALSIRDIVLIRALDVDFSSGLAVLSGETGAGKSILLDSLSLALGGRGDGGLVRVGAEQGQVTALFDLAPDSTIFDELEREGLVGPKGDATRMEPVILRRTQSADGRTRAHINDRPVSATLLRTVGRQLVEIHGQHEERAMVDPAAHRDLVDAFGDLFAMRNGVAERHVIWRRTRKELDALRARIEAAAKEADYLRASVDELNELSPQEGEEEELASRRQTMMNAEKIATDLNEAYEALAGNTSPVPTLATVMRKLERKADAAPGLLDEAIGAFSTALDGLAEAEQQLERAIRMSEFDPNELEAAEERLFALRAAARKYNVPVEGLADHAAKLINVLDDLDAGEGKLAALEDEEREVRAALKAAALDLAAARKSAGDELATRVMAELPALKLGNARFFIEQDVSEDDITVDGCDGIEFHVQTNPSTRPGPLMKVASGGELSRFLLALKVALADRVSAPTLVFDEIDTGVGGAVADAIGVRLARLADHVQVLSVTHAPQVAARARAHFLITKGADESAETRIKAIGGDERLEEVARMLSGAEVTQEARAAAGRLMDGAA
jgi:DNA repair protein RecN (Recombination protein N)